jgi:uncharacterized protein
MKSTELPFIFKSGENNLLGIIHGANVQSKTGVLIIVGGPQYRVGSHRQFVLLARFLGKHNIPVMRFDCHGMGDSVGPITSFEDYEQDIKAAIDSFFEHVPCLERVVIWGLCDAASAALFYAHQDDRVKGLILLNPWVRTESGAAKTYVKHYYLSRLTDIELWKKISKGRFDFIASFRSLLGMIYSIFSKKVTTTSGDESATSLFNRNTPLPERMLNGLIRFQGNTLFILSGNDLTADEFRDLVKSSSEWQNIMSKESVIQRQLNEANHTFSRKEWRNVVEQWSLDWLKRLK